MTGAKTPYLVDLPERRSWPGNGSIRVRHKASNFSIVALSRRPMPCRSATISWTDANTPLSTFLVVFVAIASHHFPQFVLNLTPLSRSAFRREDRQRRAY